VGEGEGGVGIVEPFYLCQLSSFVPGRNHAGNLEYIIYSTIPSSNLSVGL
jgi:hypothetical protein